MGREELFYLLALQKAKGIGAINAKKLIAHTDSAEAVFKEKEQILRRIDGIGTSTIQFLKDPENLKNAEREAEYILKNSIRFVHFLDPDYPEKLKHCIDAPLLLFSYGNIRLDNQQPIISIVGTRKMTSYGRNFMEKLIREIKKYNPIIVSGFAYGVDITAQRTAFKNQLQTIGILAHGVDTIYPQAHKKYIHKVTENGGFYTEYWHDEKPLREHFLQRNRIIAGISDATIVVESAEKGGALVTAGIANSYNREVFAVPGRVTDTHSKGCNNLIRTNKAALLHSAEDLVYMLNWDRVERSKKTIQPQLFLNLDANEKIVYDQLLKNGKTAMDNLALECQIPIHKMSGILVNLELQGAVRRLPGKLFEII